VENTVFVMYELDQGQGKQVIAGYVLVFLFVRPLALFFLIIIIVIIVSARNYNFFSSFVFF
jgi:hypothetical protein